MTPVGSADERVRSDLTLAPGPEPPVPKTEYQQPLKASHVCHVPSASDGCGFDGQKVAS